jgi:hypothetical protein
LETCESGPNAIKGGGGGKLNVKKINDKLKKNVLLIPKKTKKNTNYLLLSPIPYSNQPIVGGGGPQSYGKIMHVKCQNYCFDIASKLKRKLFLIYFCCNSAKHT